MLLLLLHSIIKGLLPFLSFVICTHLRPFSRITHWKILWIMWKFSRTSWSSFLTFADSRLLLPSWFFLFLNLHKFLYLVSYLWTSVPQKIRCLKSFINLFMLFFKGYLGCIQFMQKKNPEVLLLDIFWVIRVCTCYFL